MESGVGKGLAVEGRKRRKIERRELAICRLNWAGAEFPSILKGSTGKSLLPSWERV